MNFKPLQDNVLIKESKPEEKSKGGIIIPDAAKEKPQEGEVIAVGPGKRSKKTGENIALDVKVGDMVLYGKWSGNDIKVEGEEYRLMKESDIIGILEDELVD